MKACFINPSFKPEYGKFSRESRSPAITKSGAVYYPLWLMYAAAFTKKNGAEILFIDAPAKRMTEKDVLKKIGETSEKWMFVIDTSTPSIDNDVDFALKLRTKYPNSFILLVGTHPTACYEEILSKNEHIDAVARHEYDKIVSDLFSALDTNKEWQKINGIAYRDKNGKIICNPDMEYIIDLDSIPFASKFIKEEGMNEKDYFFAAATYPSIQIFTGRGCPCHCNFCVYPQTMHGHIFRARSAENVVNEFEYIASNFPDVKEVVIEDDTFTINKKRVTEICSMLIDRQLNKRLKWLCNARVDLDLETMRTMKKAGCRLIIPGIESGTQEILNNIHKGTKLEQIYKYVENAKKAGLLIHACYMVGNQGETKETMQKTLELALKLNTDTAQFFPLIPYPGTQAYEWARSNGYLTTDHAGYCKENGSHNTVLNLPDLSAEEMVEFCNYARRKYYLRPKYILYRIWKGLTNIDDLKRSLKAFGSLRKYLFNKK